MTSVSAGFVRRHVNGVRYGQEARERSGTDFQPSRSPSAYTSTRPQTRTEGCDEGMCVVPLGTGPVQFGPVMR